ncbi:MAG: alpha-mannosidase, partial [Eubacterium sp.]
MKRNEARVNRIKRAFDSQIRAKSEKSIVNSVVDDNKMRLMMKVCKNASHWISALENKMYTSVGTLECELWKTSEPVSFEMRKQGEYMTVKTDDVWSDNVFDCAWFHFTGDIPQGENPVCLIDISGEGLVYANNGKAIKGITAYSSEFSYEYGLPVKRVIPVTDEIVKNNRIDFYVDGACNDLQGNLCNGGKIMMLSTALCNENIRTVKYDMEVLFGIFDSLSEADVDYRYEIAVAINNAHSYIVKKDYISAHNEMDKILSQKSNVKFKITAHGHGHLDLAWLWPIRETKRKGARTFSSQLYYLDKYDDYVFGASQAQLFLWMKESYPSLYERIKKAVFDGRITIQGCSWVESDVNIPCAESLIRQMLYGSKFFKEEFNIDSTVLWLPDTFGYSGSLPQIIKKCGVEYFITQKLSWNTVNEFPYQTFNWKGTDGSEVLAHLLPANTYNGPLTPEEVLRVKNTYKENKVSDCAMLAYGIGDGGGGPSLDHAERLKRIKNVKGLPKINTVSTDEFMKKLAENRSLYPSYQGELYLERHRGTYTTQAKNKKYNRQMEIALRDCEFFSSVAQKLCGFDYPDTELEKIWKEMLLYQFHDILPGSSIARVYEESLKRYEIILNQTKKLTQNSCDAISNYYKSKLCFNSLSHSRLGIPSMGCSSEVKSAENGVYKNSIIENSKIRIILTDKGEIISLFDKESNREYVDDGRKINVFKLYNDKCDCWDIEPVYYYAFEPEYAKLERISANSNSVTVELKIGNSHIKQNI